MSSARPPAEWKDFLILFTADHSYDFRVHDGDKAKPFLSAREKAQPTGQVESIRFSNLRRDDDYTGEEVLVAAQGPGAERVRGILLNTDLFHIMLASWGWDVADRKLKYVRLLNME